MKKEKKVMKEVTEKYIECDFCGEKVNYNYTGHGGCLMCGRDACPKHMHLDHDYSDYPDAYCLSCWEIGEPFREQLDILEEEYKEKVKKIKKEWKYLGKKEAEK